MAPTFILTRTFAISALFVGAFPVSYAAPIPNPAASSMRLSPRGCRIMGCLVALPSGTATESDASTSATVPPALQIPPGGFSQESMQMLDFIISALTSARSAAVAAIPAVVQPTVKAITVDGFKAVPVVGAVMPVVDSEESATKIAEEAGEVENSIASREPSLDALV
ncbi:hypothetical protein C8Q76DRAFT_209509 [Earliella scabrosa]|nr:hypothetical protein C8Q76DRAFT_209509 [Earliella scabrosa]